MIRDRFTRGRHAMGRAVWFTDVHTAQTELGALSSLGERVQSVLSQCEANVNRDSV